VGSAVEQVDHYGIGQGMADARQTAAVAAAAATAETLDYALDSNLETEEVAAAEVHTMSIHHHTALAVQVMDTLA
jgi:hypothetical protein